MAGFEGFKRFIKKEDPEDKRERIERENEILFEEQIGPEPDPRLAREEETRRNKRDGIRDEIRINRKVNDAIGRIDPEGRRKDQEQEARLLYEEQYGKKGVYGALTAIDNLKRQLSREQIENLTDAEFLSYVRFDLPKYAELQRRIREAIEQAPDKRRVDVIQEEEERFLEDFKSAAAAELGGITSRELQNRIINIEQQESFRERARIEQEQARIAQAEAEAQARANEQERVAREQAAGRERIARERAAEIERLRPPETIDNVTFKRVTDREGNFVAFKSSAMGRKEVVLSPASSYTLSPVDNGKAYKVKVLRDTEPGKPEKGSYLVDLLVDDSEFDELDHKGAQKARAKRLRTSHGFKTLASMLNADADLSGEYRPVAERHKEYRGLHRSPEERHRNFTGMLAGIMMSERAKNLFDRVIDRTITRESDQMKREVMGSETPVYVPGIVGGAGVYGAALASARQMYLPEVPDCTIEQNERVGGQFAQYRKNLFRLNSRRRAEIPNAPHLPGTANSLNTSGEHAVMQSSDTGMESYAYQSTIADTARTNFFLAGKAMVDTKIDMVRQNFEGGKGALIVECIDGTTGRIMELATDRLTLTTGLGEENTGLSEFDDVTQNILKEEAAVFAAGGDARVMSFSQLGKRMSDPANPFPMQGMKRVILSGSGDSGNVIAGIMLGYEAQLGKTSTQLDSIEEFIWIGQDLETKEEFLQNTRTRYAAVGLEFPRQQYEDYYSRIRPIPEERSRRLERTEDGGIRVITNDFSVVEGDHFIYAHGFTDRTDEVLKPYFAETIVGPSAIEDCVSDIRTYGGENSHIYYREGSLKRLEIKDVTYDDEANTDIVEIREVYRDGSVSEARIPQSAFNERAEYLTTENIIRIEQLGSGRQLFDGEDGVDLDTEFARVRGMRKPVARSYARREASGRRGTARIFKVGPAAELELTKEEREETPIVASIYENIAENTAAIFRYIDGVVAYAERTAKQDREAGVTRPSLFNVAERAETHVLPSLRSVKAAERVSRFETSIAYEGSEKLGFSENTLDALRLGIGDTLSPYTLPADLQKLRVEVKRLYKGPYGEDLALEVSPSLPEQGYEDMLRALVNDSLVGAVLAKNLDRARDETFTMTLPFSEGRIDAARIELAMPAPARARKKS